MKIQTAILILCMYLGCSGQSERPITENTKVSQADTTAVQSSSANKEQHLIQTLKQFSVTKEADNYENIKKQIESERSHLASKNLQIDSISKIFKEALLNKIIPFWEGTEWSFEGHTSKPGLGKIACGYFVSTTLQDVGLNVNKYSLAQQSPLNEAKSLALNTEIKEFSEGSLGDNISEINRYLKEGIHFIGFGQNHVGYILKEQNNLYLIHSNYMDAAGVVIEPVETSEVFSSYSQYYLVELSTNKPLLNYWISKRLIEIIKQ